MKIRRGMLVRERGSDIAGKLVGPGPHPGEWQVQLATGALVACLQENLEPGGLNPSAPESESPNEAAGAAKQKKGAAG